jgi:hypothetical protein
MIGRTIGLLVGILSASQGLAQDQSRQLGQAVGEVKALQRSIEYVAKNCGDIAVQLTTSWVQKNRIAVNKADAVFERVLQETAKHSGQQAANDMKKSFDEMAASSVEKNVGKLSTLPPDQKAFVCKQFVSSAAAGKWDFNSKYPDDYQFLMSIK